MLPIMGLYEVALRVRELPRAEAFYREVLGLEVGLRDERRKWLFLRAGGGAGMIVLQETPGEWPPQHVAFAVGEAAIARATALLRERGVAVDGPSVHEWMPATSVYFGDPDGNELELCAPMRRSGLGPEEARTPGDDKAAVVEAFLGCAQGCRAASVHPNLTV